MALVVPYTALWSTYVAHSRDKHSSTPGPRGVSQDRASTPGWRRLQNFTQIASVLMTSGTSVMTAWTVESNVEDTVLESGLFTSEILRSGDLVSLT